MDGWVPISKQILEWIPMALELQFSNYKQKKPLYLKFRMLNSDMEYFFSKLFWNNM